MKSRKIVCSAFCLLIGGGAASTQSASANTIITPIFDSSITSLSDASSVEAAFNRVAADYASSFANPVTINIQVSWGSVAGSSLPSNAVADSEDPLYGYFTYIQVKNALTSFAQKNPSDTALVSLVRNLPPTAPTGVTRYVIPSAEAKALGLVSQNSRSIDGYIGFAGSTSGYDFDPSNGILAVTYDFEAVAAHEMAEVLGRITGLESASPTYRTPFDLLRYSSPRQLGFSYNQAAYFSIDGGKTYLGDFNTSSSGGDRSDWLTLFSSADVQDAFISTGQNLNLSYADLTVLDALGWGGSNVGDTSSGTPSGTAFALVNEVPEPGTIAIFALGVLTLSFVRRGRFRTTV